MAEPRKVPFVTVSAFSSVAAADPQNPRLEADAEDCPGINGRSGGPEMGAGVSCGLPGIDAAGDRGDGGPRRITVRLNLRLSEPSARGSAEFSYAELVQSSETKKPLERLTPAFDPSDPFADEERERLEVEGLARKFESKYGTSSRRRRTDRMQDLIDIGFGYDESDSFIDNSEAYDELVPASLTTKLGGFYINTGTLQFRAASDSDGEEAGRDKKGFQKLKGGEERVVKKRKKKQDGGNSEEKKVKKVKEPKQRVLSLNAHRPEKKKRKQLMKDSLSLAAMVRRLTPDKGSSGGSRAPNGTPVPRVPPHPHPLPHVTPPPTHLSLDPALMSLLHSTKGNPILQNLVGELDLSQLDRPLPPSSVQGENGLPVTGVGQKSCGAVLPKAQGPQGLSVGLLKPPPLPSGLPGALVKRIEDLRVASRQFDEEGRKKFFTLEMNNILLDIELQVQEHPMSVRSAVYSHLEAFVPCSRGALLKRLKKLSNTTRAGSVCVQAGSVCVQAGSVCVQANPAAQDDHMKMPLLRLKLAVCSAMPAQIAKYNMDLDAKAAKQQSEELERNASEEEDEEKPGRKAAGLRKKFIWDDRLRTLLCNLVRVKLACYAQEPRGPLSVEDYLKAFMETEVKPLWPKGWMQSRMLFKESRLVHSHLTGNLVKKKKAKPKPPPVVAPPPSAPAPCQSSASPMETICLSDSQDEDQDPVSDVSHGPTHQGDAAKGVTQSDSPPVAPPLSGFPPLVSLPCSAPKGGATMTPTPKPNPAGSLSPPKPRPANTASLLPPQQTAFCKPAIKHGLVIPSSGQTTPSPGRSPPSSRLAPPLNGFTLPKPGLATPSPDPVKSSNQSSYGSSSTSRSLFPQARLSGLASPHLNHKSSPSHKTPHSSLLKGASTAPQTSSSSSLPPSNPSPHQNSVSNFITPMQATLTKSSHSNNPPIIKLSPRPPAPAPQVSAGQTGYSPTGVQNAPHHGSVSASSARTMSVSSHVVSSSAPAVLSTNHGQHMRAGGGSSQTAKSDVGLVSVAGLSGPVTAHLSQGSSAGGVLLGPAPSPLSLSLGLLGGLVPVSLPFQFPPSLLSPATAGNPAGGNGTVLGGGSGFSPTQNVSPTQGGETKRNLH
ncbi:ubinuclein-2-like isoform X2 [Brienomyrus brachyistius]|uniref:ubinuclein-2-like isoform X2 n=1 Tax=Brienomyrus brachyistius TaxID=42636 RepID=UPI0020B37071|nr:ubinuclein-2-like isoform X2 [Brienomyrus brachyistius]